MGKKLEIGPGSKRQPGFTTFDIDGKADADLRGDAADKLPWPDNTFEIVFASHILEHIPWYYSERALREWVRVLRPSGRLEVWVPDGIKILKGVLQAENGQKVEGMRHDRWRRLNRGHDPYLWANGRIFTYGDGKGTADHPNWHRALFTPKSLRALFTKVGLTAVRMLHPTRERRGEAHTYIEMGVVGVKS
jgi:SAM-dependent methyltransferase